MKDVLKPRFISNKIFKKIIKLWWALKKIKDRKSKNGKLTHCLEFKYLQHIKFWQLLGGGALDIVK